MGSGRENRNTSRWNTVRANFVDRSQPLILFIELHEGVEPVQPLQCDHGTESPRTIGPRHCPVKAMTLSSVRLWDISHFGHLASDQKAANERTRESAAK